MEETVIEETVIEETAIEETGNNEPAVKDGNDMIEEASAREDSPIGETAETCGNGADEETKKKHRKRKKIIIIISSVCAFLLLTVVPYTVSAIIYDGNFSRYTSGEPYARDISEFPDMNMEKVHFDSVSGDSLEGFICKSTLVEDYSGVVVVSHGLGGGFANYMHIADYFTKRGFIVFGYNATANDGSEGESTNGIPQGVMDLDRAIGFVEENEETKDLPICLWGHSWGGFSVLSVLEYHPEVKAVAAVSAFSSSTDMIVGSGGDQFGRIIKLMLPYIRLYERIKFGEYAKANAFSGIEASDAKVIMVHSEKDEVVPAKYGPAAVSERFGGSDRIRVVMRKGSGHTLSYISEEAQKYVEAYNEQVNRDLPNDVDHTPEEVNAYIKEHLDKERAFEPDPVIFDDITRLFMDACGGEFEFAEPNLLDHSKMVGLFMTFDDPFSDVKLGSRQERLYAVTDREGNDVFSGISGSAAYAGKDEKASGHKTKPGDRFMAVTPEFFIGTSSATYENRISTLNAEFILRSDAAERMIYLCGIYENDKDERFISSQDIIACYPSAFPLSYTVYDTYVGDGKVIDNEFRVNLISSTVETPMYITVFFLDENDCVIDDHEYEADEMPEKIVCPDGTVQMEVDVDYVRANGEWGTDYEFFEKDTVMMNSVYAMDDVFCGISGTEIEWE